MQDKAPLVGIDYGSKLAGTTVMAYSHDRQEVRFLSSRKGEDADAFLLKLLRGLHPDQVFMDAPLSLPGVYKGIPGFSDYFYRQADRSLKAMSPMFLGGLTARAMQLSTALEKEGIDCMEVYPAALAAYLNFQSRGYKKQKEAFFNLKGQLIEKYHLKFPDGFPNSWHYFDALLALLSGLRYEQHLIRQEGSEEEGFIYV
jgi:predicted nuclease with RNAse H fold